MRLVPVLTAPDSSRERVSQDSVRPNRDGLELVDGRVWYRIADCERLAPFLAYVVSESDLWMFAGSNGAITAGRGNPDRALFPYYTQDKLFDLAGTSGALTAIHVTPQGSRQTFLWEPWMPHRVPSGDHLRHILKCQTGSMLIFEEELSLVGLIWRHRWSLSAGSGVVRMVEIENRGPGLVALRVLDGFENLLAPGISQAFQNQFSNLTDAYKKSELVASSGIGVHYLSSVPTDRAEPSEGLMATVSWCTGLEPETHLLCTAQLDEFRQCLPIRSESEVRGRRSAYLIESRLTLRPGEKRRWWMVTDTGLDAVALTKLDVALRSTGAAQVQQRLEAETLATDAGLRLRVAQVDGLQVTADELRCWRHCSNALFNCMRGGAFADGYTMPAGDFAGNIRRHNRHVYDRQRGWLEGLPAEIDRRELLAQASRRGDPDLMRLATEYLPLTFSRRHGDPSRPWNRFSIETCDRYGRPRIAYEGNWRDIFQNWEALLWSYPEYVDAVIARFVNASTADGYNPYRINERGFEWEAVEPDHPWSNIGYWGDHQIIYLLKLLELSEAFLPGRLAHVLEEERFVYAHVPYRIAGYAEILQDLHHTVAYDQEAARRIAARMAEEGADGSLLHGSDGSVAHCTLAEKLLAPLLAKLANFVPDGGVWMNTQRPEWNDANNALVGYGVSVVTLGYLHRYLEFLTRLLAGLDDDRRFRVSSELIELMRAQQGAFAGAIAGMRKGFSPATRKALMDRLGESVSAFRCQLYGRGLSGAKQPLSALEIRQFLELVTKFASAALRANRREDGLYHAYNLIHPARDGSIGLSRLDEMLEGQVSVLSAGVLAPEEAATLCDALRASRLYRPDQQSYLLQPDRDLSRFLEKNTVPAGMLERSQLLVRMIDCGDTRIVERDIGGHVRFHATFRNVAILRAALAAITEPVLHELAADEAGLIEDIYEATFHHHAFTGRSGTFFAYEGLGSVYWHMVSKLVLAIQENHRRAIQQGAPSATISRLAAHYQETLEGLGWKKSPAEYGAFPTDPYSHTPAHAGAQQPGMTGQVKEDLLTRWGELGVLVSDGCVMFAPRLLRRSEFREQPGTLPVFDFCGQPGSVEIPAWSLAFTFCQVPVVYVLGEDTSLRLHLADGSVKERTLPLLTAGESSALFRRSGEIVRVTVQLDSGQLLP